MSQNWHAHWAEDGFIPTKLQCWEVPRWHCQWPTRHCQTTQFEAHLNGRLFASFKRSDPWGNYKGTWELPKKIDRKTAENLSRSSEYKKAFWIAHKRKHLCICRGQCKTDKQKRIDQEKEEKNVQLSENQIKYLNSKKLKKRDIVPKERCKISPQCIL